MFGKEEAVLHVVAAHSCPALSLYIDDNKSRPSFSLRTSHQVRCVAKKDAHGGSPPPTVAVTNSQKNESLLKPFHPYGILNTAGHTVAVGQRAEGA